MALTIPPTSVETYVSDIVALNIHSPQGTGDWHTAATLAADFPHTLFIYGNNQPHNTNHLLGDTGVIDGTERLHNMGYRYQNEPVFIADHPRACFDMLYTTSLQNGILNNIVLDDWFPALEDKQAVYNLILQAEPKLNESEKARLQQWKKMNPLV